MARRGGMRRPVPRPQFTPQHLIPKKKEQLSTETMDKFGLGDQKIEMAENIQQLIDNPPFMVLATCKKDFSFMKDRTHRQRMDKGTTYLMALGMYDQLRYNPQLGRDIFKPFKRAFKDVYKRWSGEDLNDKTLLIWRTGGIGDFLFIKPNLDKIKSLYPNSKIWFACGNNYQPMLNEWECIDRVLDLPIEFHRTFQKADYHMTFEGVIERNKEAHEKNAYDLMSAWFGFDLSEEEKVPRQKPNATLVETAKGTLKGWGVDEGDFILLQQQPSSPVRTVDPKKWVEVIDELTSRGHKVVLTDSPPKAPDCEALKNQCKDKDMIFNYAEHSKEISYTIALCSLAKAVIGPDSSLTHIACSLDVPCYGIFGPFLGDLRMRYYPKGAWKDCGTDMECHACFLHGYEPCPEAKKLGTPFSPCLQKFEAAEVVDELEKLL